MKIGLIGLGKMGGNMATRLIRAGHEIVGFDLSEENRLKAAEQGAEVVTSLEDLIAALPERKVVWVMVPHGKPTESTLAGLLDRLSENDIVIDGGNSNYQDSIKRGETFSAKGMFFLDAGTSGGIWGLDEGYCLMIGGDTEPVVHVSPIFAALAPNPKGWLHVGPTGSGHFVKMVHNGIEYGMMQAYAEGLELMRAKEEFGLNIANITELWRHGSVVRSWLLDLTAEYLKNDPELKDLSDYVSDSGEGRWTVIDSIQEGVPAPVITLSVQMRLRSQQDQSYAGKVLSAMRNAFGGHAVKKVSDE